MFLTKNGDGLVDIVHTLDPLVSKLPWLGEVDNLWSIIIKVVLACLIGGLIGAERATKHHVAGLRTHMLVCLGATVAMMINEFIALESDVARLGAGVLTGIGFLGAGTMVVTSRNQVKGLTTAAALWASAALGLAIGIAFFTLALTSAALILIALVFLPKIESKIQKNSKAYDIHVELSKRTDLKLLLELLRSKNIVIRSIAYDSAYAGTGLSVYSLSLLSKPTKDKKFIHYQELITELQALEYVNFAEFMN